jgi:DNA-binding response OmpR family regulator
MPEDCLRLHPHSNALILLATNNVGFGRGLASSLADDGFRVVTTHNERDTVEKAQTERPHAIVLDVAMAPPGYGLCRTLRSVSLGTPIVLTTARPPTREEKLEAVRAGAWEICATPLDIEYFVARLGAYVEPKVELDRVSEECLVDGVSGLYNELGLARRAAELAALATRHGFALACVVFRPSDALPTRTASDQLALTFKTVGRSSDAVGRTGRSEFAVFAPASNTWAASRLVHRLTDRAGGYGSGIDLRSGYSSAHPAHKIASHTLLARARSALEAARPPG